MSYRVLNAPFKTNKEMIDMLRIITGNLQAAYNEFRSLTCYDLIHLDKHTLSRVESNVIIEHPCVMQSEKAQFTFGLTLCEVPNDLTIFTHSSALINGVRVGVKRGIMSHKNVVIVFYTDEGEATELHMNHIGRFDKWPDGFIDTWDKALEELLDT